MKLLLWFFEKRGLQVRSLRVHGLFEPAIEKNQMQGYPAPPGSDAFSDVTAPLNSPGVFSYFDNYVSLLTGLFDQCQELIKTGLGDRIICVVVQ